ncbi:MAG: hypothetical protein ABEI86_15425 [Halobacteriaceae archaeon]
MVESNHASHWVSKVIDSNWPVSISNPFLSSVVWFGALPNVFFIFIILFQPKQVPNDFFSAIFLGVLWLNIGPFLIWYYDEKVLPTFFEDLTELLQNEDRISQLNKKYDKLFSNKYWIPTLIWTLLLLTLFFISQSFLAEEGLFEVGGVFYYTYLFSVTWLGIFTGIGFMGVLTTVLAIREIAKEPLDISPLHPDGLGGLGIFGYYAIRTTITFSTGSLLLPLSFIFVRARKFDVLIYLIVIAYMGAIALSFIYPTYKINRQAQRIRDETADELRREYETARQQMKSAGGITDHLGGERGLGEEASSNSVIADDTLPNTTELIGQLELQRLRNEYEDYQNVRLYPFQLDILIKLVSSILLPIFFILIDEALDFIL